MKIPMQKIASAFFSEHCTKATRLVVLNSGKLAEIEGVKRGKDETGCNGYVLGKMRAWEEECECDKDLEWYSYHNSNNQGTWYLELPEGWKHLELKSFYHDTHKTNLTYPVYILVEPGVQITGQVNLFEYFYGK